MRKMLKKATAAMLVTTLAVGLLSGCGGKTKVVQKTQMDKDHVYHGDYFDLPEGISAYNLKPVGDTIFIDGYNEKNDYRYEICSMDLKTGETSIIYKDEEKNQTGVNLYDIDSEGNVVLFTCIYEVVQGTEPGESTMPAIEEEEYLEKYPEGGYEEYVNHYYFKKYSPKGELLSEKEVEFGEDVYPERMKLDAQGNILITSYEKSLMYDSSFELIGENTDSAGSIDTMYLTKDGKIGVLKYSDDYMYREMCEFDFATKKFTEAKKMENVSTSFSFYPAQSYDFLIRDTTDLYGYNNETGEKTKILNWIDSDINCNFINGIADLSDGRIICSMRDWSENKSQIAVLSKIPPEEVVDKTILTLATVYENDLSRSIINFNKTNDEYRIQLKDYSVYNTEEDYSAGVKKLNTDLVSGEIPDILFVNNELPFENYVKKGLFTDINVLMEKDETFNRSDYLENIFEAFETDGKLYSVVPCFDVATIVGKTSVVGDKMGWTMEDYRNVMKKQPEGTKPFSYVTRENILYYAYSLCMDDFIDWETGKCNFDCPEFKEILEFANEFPSDEEYYKQMEQNGEAFEDPEYNGDMAYRSGKVLLQFYYQSNFKDLHYLQKAVFGEDVTFIGFPAKATTGSTISTSMQFAIAESAVSKDAAWDFVKEFLSDNYQENHVYGWPVKLSAIEKIKENDMKPATYTDENGKLVEYEETYYLNGKEEKLGLVTEEECEKTMELLKSLSHVQRNNESISNIINEEAGAFFSGQKSVDETCKLIQNRVQTYVSESQ